MRLVNCLVIGVVGVACLVDGGTVVNPDVADLLFVLDLLPHERNFSANSDYTNTGGLSLMMKSLAEKLPIDDRRMRYAILESTDGVQTTTQVKFINGTIMNKVVLNHSMIQAGKARNVTSVIKDAKDTAFKEDFGHRLVAPKVTIYIGLYPMKDDYEDEGSWTNGMNAYVGKLHTWSSLPSIAVMAASYIDQEHAAIQQQKGQGMANKKIGTDLADEIFRRLISLLSCPSQYNDGQCFYASNKTDDCVTKRKYTKPPGGGEYCVDGTLHWDCPMGKNQCEVECTNASTWSKCDCKTLVKERLKPPPSGQFYANCPNVRTKSCKDECWGEFDDEDQYPVLKMPVWAIIFIVLCILLIMVVVGTLIIYFKYFPIAYIERPPRPPPPPRRAHRFTGSMIEFLRKFRVIRRGHGDTRNPGTSRGRTRTGAYTSAPDPSVCDSGVHYFSTRR